MGYPITGDNTTFQEIYDRFFGKITDDMYLEWNKSDTERDLYNILMDALPGFEFPRFPLYDFNEIEGSGTSDEIINLDDPQEDTEVKQY